MIRRLCLCCVELADHVDPQKEKANLREAFLIFKMIFLYFKLGLLLKLFSLKYDIFYFGFQNVTLSCFVITLDQRE